MDKVMKGIDGRIPASLPAVISAISATLRSPNNLGIECRHLTHTAAFFIHGLVDEELVRLWALEPLERAALQQPGAGRLSPDMLCATLPAPRIRIVQSMGEAIQGILAGATALFLDGGQAAILVETQLRPPAGSNSGKPSRAMFGTDLTGNLALIRKRLPDPALVAEPRRLPRCRADAALVYLAGLAEPGLITAVSKWLQEKGAEEALSRGGATGLSGLIGLLPDLMSIQWPDKVSVLLEAGYVAVLVDGLPHACVAPVTASAMFYSPGDVNLRQPLAYVLRAVRVVLAALVLTVPAAVVALMSYHQEMLPTPFLLAMARTRDNALFPILLEVLGLEILQEVLREAASRLPLQFGAVGTLLAGTLLVLLLVQTQLVSPLPGVASVLVAVAALGLPSVESIGMSRVWRFWMIAGAGIFGFYGYAAVAFFSLVYLTQARSFQIAVVGETGLWLNAPGRSSSRKGGQARAQG